jgi:phage tail protein X
MTIYKTIAGDTWDAISYRAYGSEFYVNKLIDANLDHINTFIFSANITLNIPDINVAINELLPPWERLDITNNTDSDNELLDIVNGFDGSRPNMISYRFVDRYTKRMTATTKEGY